MGDPRPFTREISIDILRGAVRMKKGFHGTAGVSFEELVSSESNLQRLRQTACQSRNTTDIRLELFRLRARWERLCELIYESARFIGSFEDLDHHMIDLPTDEYIKFRKVILISYLIYVFNKFVVLIHLSSICQLQRYNVDRDTMNHDVSNLGWFKLAFGSVPTVNGRPPPKSVSTHEGSSTQDSDDDFMPDKHGNLPWKKKGKSVASMSTKKKKSSDASAKRDDDSDDDFMPDKHGNLPWKKIM
jgi:hypothetical protein